MLRLLGPPDSAHEFEPREMVFPPNMQLGVDLPALLDEVQAWRERTAEVFEHCKDDSRWCLDESSALAAGVAEILGNLPSTMSEILASLGMSRSLATERAALLLLDGGLVPAPEETAPADDDLRDVFAPDLDPVELAAEDRTSSDGSLGLVSLQEGDFSVEPVDRLDQSLDVPVESGEYEVDVEIDVDDDPPIEGDEDLADESHDADDGIAEADYERAAQGGFIKSYEVLDKVDLSGVDVLGTWREDLTATRPHAASVSLHSLGEIEAIGDLEIEAGEDIEIEAPAADSDRFELPDLEISRGPAEDSRAVELTAFETGDFEAVFDHGSVDQDAEDALELEGGAPLDADKENAAPEMQIVTSAKPSLESVDANARERFTQSELEGFAERITVFSSIFRIIFSTFSEHIGEKKARQRFNALLGASQRQYPELFRRLEIGDDGSLEPATLINNLAACPPGDYGSLLHQGLYELIFSHLYDAKDLLPGDAETGMMEKIVVHERQLQEA